MGHGLIRYSCGHISVPHEPIPTKFGQWRFFIMLHRYNGIQKHIKTLKCKKKKVVCNVSTSVIHYTGHVHDTVQCPLGSSVRVGSITLMLFKIILKRENLTPKLLFTICAQLRGVDLFIFWVGLLSRIGISVRNLHHIDIIMCIHPKQQYISKKNGSKNVSFQNGDKKNRFAVIESICSNALKNNTFTIKISHFLSFNLPHLCNRLSYMNFYILPLLQSSVLSSIWSIYDS